MLVVWWDGPADKKTAKWIAGIHFGTFEKKRALLKRCESQFVITIEDDIRSRVFWVGEDYAAACAAIDQLDGRGVITIDLTELALLRSNLNDD